jgi:hypothetical protein
MWSLASASDTGSSAGGVIRAAVMRERSILEKGANSEWRVANSEWRIASSEWDAIAAAALYWLLAIR